MTDGRCEACKWWGREIEVKGLWEDCGLTIRPGANSDHGTLRAIAADDQGNNIPIETRHDFGCVQWEAKDA